MSKVVLDDIPSGYSSATKLSANMARLVTAIDNSLSRQGAAPNQMEAELDMNSNEITNLGSPTTGTSAARWADVTGALAVSTPLPSQVGNAGKVIATDGTTLVWTNAGSSAAPLYLARSLAEIAAGVTPTNYTYPPGNPLRYGADPSGVADSASAIQTTIDLAAYFGGASPTIPEGLYKVTTTLQLGYGESLRSVHLRGAGMRYAGGASFSGTAIITTFKDRPVFAFNGSRSSSVKDLTVLGANAQFLSNNQMGFAIGPLLDDLVAANWVDPTFPASASSRYAPHCAFAIDPYSGAAPATAYPNVSYPSWSGISAQYGKYHSSDCLIERVGMHGFVVGVVNKPCNDGNQADFTKINKCIIDRCQYAVSVGNTQSRNFVVRDSQISQCHTAVVTGKHGQQLGKPAILFDNVSMTMVMFLQDIPTVSWGSGLTFRNVYAEIMYSLGSVTGSNAALGSRAGFEDCEFGFDAWTARGTPAVMFTCKDGPQAEFKRTKLVAPTTADLYSSPNVFAMDALARDVRFDGEVVCGWAATKKYEKHAINATAGIVFANATHECGSFSARQTNFFNLNDGSAAGARTLIDINSSGNRPFGIMNYSRRIRTTEDGGDEGFGLGITRNSISKAACTSISTSGSAVTVNCTGALVGAWQLIHQGGDVGDVVFDSETKTVFFVEARTGLTLTLRAQTNRNAAGNLRVAPTTAGTLYALNCRLYTPYTLCIGDFATGTPTITNVKRPDGSNSWINDAVYGMQTGDFIYAGSGTTINPTVDPAAASITAFGSGTITVASNLSYAKTRERLTLFVRAPPANNT